ncbi:hypothetical protein AGOR_G00010310 [Albula goreensis]|uniref:Uncharacterized protein n=1 Tax=Albula goreensis TaxID=1534307 RepID=A0A8T3EBV5_9TELE|nr:hypothetical protein AGOR_G00010310 [Albula goreensis]
MNWYELMSKICTVCASATGTGAVCASPEERAGKSLQDSGVCFPGSTTTQPPLNIKPTSPQMINTPTTAQSRNSQNKVAAPDLSGGPPKQGNTWKFLVGVVVTVICTSMLLVCAIKSPSWYKLMFNYRHQRLREEESNVFTTGRYSNFSLDTEQTETSIQELEVELDNEDGYIEDRYIDAGDYKDAAEA